MGGKSRKSGGVSKALIDRIKKRKGSDCCGKKKDKGKGFGILERGREEGPDPELLDK